MSGIEILENFNEYELSYDQANRAVLPGDTVIKGSTGVEYGYGIVGGAFSKGQILRSARHTDLTVGTTDTVTEAAAIGTDELVDAGAFAGKQFTIPGARGVIKDGPGVGQNFYVKRWVNNDKVKVVVLSDFSGVIDNGKWKTALTTASKYDLFLPGVFFAQDSLTLNDDEGFAQVAATADDIGKARLYIPRDGRLMASWLSTGNPLVAGDRVIKAANGTIQGYNPAGTDAATATTKIAALESAVGYAIHADITGSTNGLVWINGDIKRPSRNFSSPFHVYPYDKVELRS